MWRLAPIVVVFLGCGAKDKDKSDDKAKPAVDCKAAGEGVKAYWAKKVSSGAEADKPNAQKMMAIASQRIVQHCMTDGWSADAVDCAKTAQNLEACKAKLTPEQIEKLKADPESQPTPVKPPTGNES